MNCGKSQHWLALQAEGDLPRRRQPRLERHLRSCPQCTEFARGLEESQGAVRALRGDSMSDEALLQVRGSVLSRITATEGASGTALWPWRAGLAAGLALLLLGVIALVSAPRKAPEAPAPEVRGLPTLAEDTPSRPVPVTPTSPTRGAPLKGSHPAPHRGQTEREPLVVKLLTDDPDIVIIWLLETTEVQSHE